jgi:hypothetical protein
MPQNYEKPLHTYKYLISCYDYFIYQKIKANVTNLTMIYYLILYIFEIRIYMQVFNKFFHRIIQSGELLFLDT